MNPNPTAAPSVDIVLTPGLPGQPFGITAQTPAGQAFMYQYLGHSDDPTMPVDGPAVVEAKYLEIVTSSMAAMKVTYRTEPTQAKPSPYIPPQH